MDLVPIPLRGNKVIIVMDRLSPNGGGDRLCAAVGACQDPKWERAGDSGQEATNGPALCSAARARRNLQQGCSGYVAYVMDTREVVKETVSDVQVVREYPDIFPKDLHGIPLER